MVEVIKSKIGGIKKIINALTFSVIFCLGLYVYFVGNTVYSVVNRQQIEKKISEVEASLEKTEADYLSLKEKVTLELAQQKGFKNVSATKFISRNSIGKGLSLNNEI